MPFAKPLPFVPASSRRSAVRPPDQHIASQPMPETGNKARTSLLRFPRQKSPRRTIATAVSRLMAEAGALVVHVAGALPNAPIAIVSWLVAEFCAGCAAYALAMYPIFPLEDHDSEGRDGPPTAVSGQAPQARTAVDPAPATAARGRDGDGVVPFRAPDKPAVARAPSSKAGATSIRRGDIGAAVRQERRWD